VSEETPFVELRGIEKSFGRKLVLRGVDLAIHRGETVVVVGGSGSGKSVLLRHIIGLLKPDVGSVLVEGEEITDYNQRQLLPIRKKIGMLFQGGALFDSMDVFDNVSYGLREHTTMNHEEIAKAVAEKL